LGQKNSHKHVGPEVPLAKPVVPLADKNKKEYRIYKGILGQYYHLLGWYYHPS
jgi:hypothetical protein